MAIVVRYDAMGWAGANTVMRRPCATSCGSPSRPLKTPTRRCGTSTLTRYIALSDGVSFTGYQVKAPKGSCIVHTSPADVVCQPILR